MALKVETSKEQMQITKEVVTHKVVLDREQIKAAINLYVRTYATELRYRNELLPYEAELVYGRDRFDDLYVTGAVWKAGERGDD